MMGYYDSFYYSIIIANINLAHHALAIMQLLG